jgi:GT2 family glycosyltransferase
MISFVIPSYNPRECLGRSIKSLLMLRKMMDIEIIVVDDFSDEGKYMPNIRSKHLKIIRLKKNGGAAHARNVGIEESKGETILFLDNDIILDSDSAKRLVEALDKADISFPRVIYKNQRIMYPFSKEDEAYPLISACFAIKRSSLHTLKNYFDESFGTYMEDCDFFLRCRQAGLTAIYVKEATALHIKTRSDSLRRYGLELRNLMYGMRKHRGKYPFTFSNLCKSIACGILNFAWFDWDYDRSLKGRQLLILMLSGKHKISEDYFGIQLASLNALTGRSIDRREDKKRPSSKEEPTALPSRHR